MADQTSTLILPGTVHQAAAGLSGFDSNTPLSAAKARGFKQAGYHFCIRYVPRTASLTRGNLTHVEALAILNAGLALMVVQHVPLPGWVPSASLGTDYGNYAAIYGRQTVGLPSGVNIWCDLEGVASGTSADDVIAYSQAWYQAVFAAGYLPGLYVGYNAILTAQQLYQNLSFRHYWRAYNGPQVATRGFQLIQQTQKEVNGLMVDPDISQTDHLGGSVSWLSL